MNKNLLAGYKTFFGLLGFSSIVSEVSTLVERGALVPSNFFSYFTIQSNIFVSAVFLISAISLYSAKRSKIDVWRGAATLYIVVVGVGFALLLSNIENAQFTAVAWNNIVLHYIIPIAAAIDWIIDPPKKRMRKRTVKVWMVAPIIYATYTLVRGAIVDWYPYPFIDPRDTGYLTVLITIGIVGVIAFGFAKIMTFIPLRLKAKS